MRNDFYSNEFQKPWLHEKQTKKQADSESQVKPDVRNFFSKSRKVCFAQQELLKVERPRVGLNYKKNHTKCFQLLLNLTKNWQLQIFY